jgi:MtN3 and saliva related transmembrane protein
MTLLSTLATLFGILNGLANILQAWKIFRRKSAKDISVLTFSIFLVGTIVWTFYGFELGNSPILISNFIGIIGLSLVVIGWFLYGRS